MIVYLFIKEDNIIYGYHTKEVEDTIPFETDLDEKEWAEYFASVQNAVKLVDGKIETFEIFDKKPLELELLEIYRWFVDNDYIPNKIITNEWTTDDARWKLYLNERFMKRKRQDELNALLGE